MPTLVADKSAGLVIANTVLAALVRRERTGEGSDITIAMTEVMRAYLLVEHGANAIPNRHSGPAGYPRILNPDRRPHPTADGMISVLPYDEHHYETLFRLGGREDLLDDPRLATQRSRIENGPSLYQDVAGVLKQRTSAEWLASARRRRHPRERGRRTRRPRRRPAPGRSPACGPLPGDAATHRRCCDDRHRAPTGAAPGRTQPRGARRDRLLRRQEIDGLERDGVLFTGTA